MIGVGGFARVMRAYDESLDDSVAIKVLSENWAEDTEIRTRFVEEARLLRRVRSEHLVTVHDIGELDDGRPFFVMEFADAGTLAGRLKTRPTGGLDPASARAIIEALTDGLGALHAAGVVHRDVNPKNLLIRHGREGPSGNRADTPTQLREGLIGPAERLLLGDLGLAKDVVRSGSDAVSLVGGTANYMPPEQVDPAGSVGPATDVYAATGVIWECLVGTPPPASTALGEASRGLDKRWRTFFATGFALDAADRYESMAKWRAAALECLNEGGPLSAGRGAGSSRYKTDDSPYLGLAAFQPQDADRFFGRAALIRELLGRVRDQRMLVVAGASGSGKSSLVRAGLIPAIAGGALPGSERWPVALLTPGARPMSELAYQLSKLAANATQQAANSVTAEELSADPNRGRLLGDLITSATGGALIVIDQFEELFTQGLDRDRQQLVLDALAALIDPVDSQVRVVLAVRADFYGVCASFPWLAEKITANQVLVGPMTRPELREAIEEPARRAGLVIEEAVVDAVLDDGGAEPGTLPLVSHALAETWRRRRGSMMTLDGYREAGGVSGAIAQTANSVYDDHFDAAERAAVRRLMLRLVTPGDGTPDTKRPLAIADLNKAGDETLQRVTEQMTAARLLTASEDTVEIAHEALIRTWPRLRQWIEESRDDLRMRQHIASAATEWVEQDRDSDLLYRGTPLEAALDWADSKPDVLEPSDQEFLDSSKAARDDAAAEAAGLATRSTRIRRIAVSVLSVLTVVAVISGLTAINASRQSNARFSQSLALQAAGLATDDPRVALALAVEAIARGQTDSFEARSALVDASRILGESPLAPAASSFVVGDALSVAVSPDGSLVASGYRDGTVQIWEPMMGAAVGTIVAAHDGAINDIVFTADGTGLITASNDRTVRLWDVSDPANVTLSRVVGTHDGIVWRIALSPDSSTVAAASEDGTVREWDLATGMQRGPSLIDITRDFLSVAYSPDGSIILGGNGRGELHGWIRATGEPALETFNAHRSDLWHIEFAPSGTTFATSSSDGTVRVWTLNGDELAQPYAGASENGAGIAFSATGTLMIGSAEGRVVLWDPDTQRIEVTPPGHGGEILDAAMTPDGSELITLSTDQTVRAWTPPVAPQRIELTGNASGSLAVAVASDGTVASGDVAGAVRIFDQGSTTGDPVADLVSPAGISAIAFGDGNRLLAAASADGSWWLVDVVTRAAVLGPIPAHEGPITAVALADGLIVTGGDDGLVRIWDENGTLVRDLAVRHAGGVTALAASGSKLATADRSGVVHIFDVGSGTIAEGSFQADDNTIWALSFSPNGSLLATASGDEVVTIWDVASLEPLSMLTPHDADATGVAFLDDATVASVDLKGTVRLWDVALGRQLGSALQGHDGAARGLAAGPDGRFATSGADGTLYVWDVLNLEAACAKSQGTFDAEQQRRYLQGTEAAGCTEVMP